MVVHLLLSFWKEITCFEEKYVKKIMLHTSLSDCFPVASLFKIIYRFKIRVLINFNNPRLNVNNLE